jgi:NADPH-dependent curcumin reductase CurA
MVTSREWHLTSHPTGMPTADDVALITVDLPEPGPGEVLVANTHLSLDPYMRGRMNDVKSYAAPFALDRPMGGEAVGRVVASQAERLPVGAMVRSFHGWREAYVAPAREVREIDPKAAAPADYLGVLGMPALTAWVGLYDIGELRPGQTVFVSAGTGAVGSIACQLAKLADCRVIATTGSDDKVAYLHDDLGVDVALNYREGHLRRRVAEAAPEGVDVYFDNVGGEHLAAALTAMNDFGHVIACGMIADYNDPQPGPNNLMLIVGKKLTVRGFIVTDHLDREPAFRRHVGALYASGALRYPVTTVHGIERAFEAFLSLFTGEKGIGKLLVELNPVA